MPQGFFLQLFFETACNLDPVENHTSHQLSFHEIIVGRATGILL
jgi:hypothetical protein